MKKFILLLVVTIGYITYGQKEQDSLLNIWNNKKRSNIERAMAYLEYIKYNKSSEEKDAAIDNAKVLYDFIESNELKTIKGDIELILGNIYYEKSYFDNALIHYKNALALFRDKKNQLSEAKILSNIGRIYGNHFKYDEELNYYKESLSVAEEIEDSLLIAELLVNFGDNYGNRFKLNESSAYYLEALKILKSSKKTKPLNYIYANLGNNYDQLKKSDTANYYYFKSLEISRQHKDLSNERRTLHLLSRSYFRQTEYLDAIKYAKMSIDLDSILGDTNFSTANYYTLADAYKVLNDNEKALFYLEKATNLESQLRHFNANKKLQEMEISRIRAEDSLNNITEALKIEVANQKEKNNLTIAWGGSLCAVSIFAFLIYRNTKQKQRKAEKERQQEIEEKEKLLKDLEVSAIDAMVRGQEKERERLASDLHDNVGATIAAAKLQFNYLIKHQNDKAASEELIKKTSSLLEDAYVEIRSMAHLKNSGVMAKNGLLPAIKKLSHNASGTNGLQFKVKSHGLEQRLDNALEISIFRIIQELITNIIKHADATKSTIHLTNHQDSLNIIVEDDGKGFNPSQISKNKKGMGISSIDKRVAHLNGKLIIESKKNRGTTVIIDVPL